MTPPPEVPEEIVSPRQKRVLIVEDYDDVRAMMTFMLKRRNLEVLEARNGQEAIEVSCGQHLDLILMDLSMPIMDGFTATQHIKGSEATRSIPIVALSAHCHQTEYHARALLAGCFDCLSKPVDWPQLEKILLAI
jgi:two-component system cell cycle response regulator DivK